ncbi:hypothetical protein BKA70DRAFT_1578396 [Coprinopsis sp. MPI-PUGE-AT-0042]|nr:hypothetical protein BKA70DRAFT_1578396 [Coprinopsis sp. MPI-PUGE-AT-0042]
MKTVQDARKRIASLKAQLAARKGDWRNPSSRRTRRSLWCFNWRECIGTASVGHGLEGGNGGALGWAILSNKALEVEIGILANTITPVRSFEREIADDHSLSALGPAVTTTAQLDPLTTASSSTAMLTPAPLLDELPIYILTPPSPPWTRANFHHVDPLALGADACVEGAD